MVNLITVLTLAALFIPQSNDDTLSQTPLNRGEAAFIERGNNVVSLNIGDCSVTDLTALRGYIVEKSDRNDFVCQVSGGFTYDGQYDNWRLNQVGSTPLTNTVTITTTGRKIHEVELSALYTTGAGTVVPSYERVVNGNTAVYVFVWPSGARNCSIDDVSVSYLRFGDPEATTDLNSHIFNVVDSLGLSSLGGWRKWAANLYNGNRGEDWSKYEAVSTISLNGNSIAFDADVNYAAMINSDTNLVVLAGGRPAIKIAQGGTSTYYQVEITSYAVTNKISYIGFTHAIENFNPDNLTVMATSSVVEPVIWEEISPVSKSNGMAVIGASSGANRRFFKLVYDGTLESRVVMITLTGNVNVTGELSVGGKNILVTLTNYIDHTNATFSNEVLQVGLNIDTNLVAAINAMQGDEGAPIGEVTTVFGLLTALAAAVAWLKKNKLTKGMTAGVPDDPNVASLFSGENTSLMGVVRYGIGGSSSSTMADRTINNFTMAASTELVFPASVDGKARDFLLDLTYSAGTMTLPSGVTKVGDDLSFTAGKEYLLTFTEIAANRFYVRSIEIA